MSHGRFIFAVLLAFAGGGRFASAQGFPLQFSWVEADHPSGIYHVKSDARMTVVADNPSPEPVALSGEIVFGARSGGEFKPLAVTPVAASLVAPGQRARVPLEVTFGAAGPYELHFRQGGKEVVIEGSQEKRLHAIFAPRVDVRKESPWITLLPRAAALSPGALADSVEQTSVRRFVIDERFSYDSAANIGLGFGASTGGSVNQVEALMTEAAKAKAMLTLRVSLPLQVGPDVVVESINAFRKYVEDAIRRSKGTLTAIVIVPERREEESFSDAQRSLYRSYYLAGHEAAKKADKNVQMLGPGSAALAAEIFRGNDPKLLHLDALAMVDASLEPLIAAQLLGERKMPLHILPPAPGEELRAKAWPPAAAGLAARAVVVPLPPSELDNGVTAHLLGGAAFAERLRLGLPSKDAAVLTYSSVPFVALFQGDGYSVAAIAGFGAGTDLDGLYPSLARLPSTVESVKEELEPAYANLEVGDDSRAMRVVDGQGSPVDCRLGGGGDSLFVPAGDKVVYLLEANAVEELAGTLRASTANHLPLFEASASWKEGKLTVGLRNISAAAHGGSVKVLGTLADGKAGDTPAVAGIKEFTAIAAGNEEQIAVEVDAGLNRELPIVLEIKTGDAKGVIQRTAISVARPAN